MTWQKKKRKKKGETKRPTANHKALLLILEKKSIIFPVAHCIDLSKKTRGTVYQVIRSLLSGRRRQSDTTFCQIKYEYNQYQTRRCIISNQIELNRNGSHCITSKLNNAIRMDCIVTKQIGPHRITSIWFNWNIPHWLVIASKLFNAIRMDHIVVIRSGPHCIASNWFNWNIPHWIVLNHIESDRNGPHQITMDRITSCHITSYCNGYKYNQSQTWCCTASNRIEFNKNRPHYIASKLINAIGMNRIVTNQNGPHRIASIWFDWYILIRIVLNHFTADWNGPHRIATDQNG